MVPKRVKRVILIANRENWGQSHVLKKCQYNGVFLRAKFMISNVDIVRRFWCNETFFFIFWFVSLSEKPTFLCTLRQKICLFGHFAATDCIQPWRNLQNFVRFFKNLSRNFNNISRNLEHFSSNLKHFDQNLKHFRENSNILVNIRNISVKITNIFVEISNISVKILNISVEISDILVNISNILVKISNISVEISKISFTISKNIEHFGWYLKEIGRNL